ncbi:MAG: L-lactate permease [Anaerolineae bacterium]|jgi:lactate permease
MVPGAGDLPITLLHWGAALLPILVLLVLLVGLRWSTAAAGPAALAVAVAVALLLFRTPLFALGVAVGKGIWDALFILYVIWPALIFYNVAEKAGAFTVMQREIRKAMPDRLLVVLVYAWVLASFIQSIAGFGTPLAVTAPLLVGLGVRPLYAVVLPLVGPAWANSFGSLGATWLATLAVVDVANPARTLLYAGILLWIPNLTGALAICWFYGRGWGLRRGLPAVLAISLVQGGLQLALLQVEPTIACFVACGAGLGVTFALNRWSFYRQEDEDEPNLIFVERRRDISMPPGRAGSQTYWPRTTEPMRAARRLGARRISLKLTFVPYIILAVLTLGALAIPPVHDRLAQVGFGPPFPGSETGYGVIREAEAPYSPLEPLVHPGTFLLLSALIGYVIYSRGGYYRPGTNLASLVGDAAEGALPSTAAITALLTISSVMDHSGQVTLLGLGIAVVAPTLVVAAASPLIGALGAMITSSNTASNILFAPLQAQAAAAEGIAQELAIAGQTAGGATGNALAPGDALLGATIVGQPEQVGSILRKILPWTLIVAVLVAGATLLLHLLG